MDGCDEYSSTSEYEDIDWLFQTDSEEIPSCNFSKHTIKYVIPFARTLFPTIKLSLYYYSFCTDKLHKLLRCGFSLFDCFFSHRTRTPSMIFLKITLSNSLKFDTIRTLNTFLFYGK